MPDSSTGTVAKQPEQLVRIGCAGLPSGVSRSLYFKRLDLLETDATLLEPPGDAALRRWRREAPPGSSFTMLAWQLVTHEASAPTYERLLTPLSPGAAAEVGHFRATERVRAAWERTLAAAKALGAEVILFQTPPSFSPSAANRDAMRRFFGEVVGEPPRELRLAWEPRGIWQPAQADALARELGLVYAVDPLQLEIPPPEGAAAYFRLHGLGLYRNRIGEEHLDLIAELVDPYEETWVVFANVEKFSDAQRFRRLYAGRAFIEDEP